MVRALLDARHVVTTLLFVPNTTVDSWPRTTFRFSSRRSRSRRRRYVALCHTCARMHTQRLFPVPQKRLRMVKSFMVSGRTSPFNRKRRSSPLSSPIKEESAPGPSPGRSLSPHSFDNDMRFGVGSGASVASEDAVSVASLSDDEFEGGFTRPVEPAELTLDGMITVAPSRPIDYGADTLALCQTLLRVNV